MCAKEVKEDIRGVAMEMAGLVEYQKDSVVSRTLISKKVGTITAFAFDEGQGLSEHTAPYDATVLVLDGEVEITIEGEPLTLRAGGMAIMPANRPHALVATRRFKMLLIMIRE